MFTYDVLHHLTANTCQRHSCDRTSRPYGIGKISAVGKYVDLKGASQIFMLPKKDHNEVGQVGNEALAIIYACTQDTDLNLERAAKFSEKVASSS